MSNKITENDRGDVVENVQIYYIDFLQRCKDYGSADSRIPRMIPVKDDSAEEIEEVPRMPDFKMNAERSAKMTRYKTEQTALRLTLRS